MQASKSFAFTLAVQSAGQVVNRNPHDLGQAESFVNLQDNLNRFQVSLSKSQGELPNDFFQVDRAPSIDMAPSHTLDAQDTVKSYSCVTKLPQPEESLKIPVPSADSPEERKKAYYAPLEHVLQHSDPAGRTCIDRSVELQADKPETIRERILARIEAQEAKAGDYETQLSFRLGWHLVQVAFDGEAKLCTPLVLVYYRVVGCHPDHYYTKIMANRRAMLGTEYNKVRFPKHSARAAADTGAAKEAPIASKSAAPVPINPKKAGIA